MTVLHWAALYGDVELVKLLVSKGAEACICICIVSTLLVSYVAKREYSKATKSNEKECSKADAPKKLKY